MSDVQQSAADLAWQHIAAERFEDAEPLIRECIARADRADNALLWHLSAWLAGVLNSLARHDEATAMLQQALVHARALGPGASEFGVARYMLADQALLFGEPADALDQTRPIPEGAGHIQCLLHSVAAHALWKLNRLNEARLAAMRALDAAPSSERRGSLADDLAEILSSG
jgi:tetratricopeptide (TPR) repeat protein